MKVYKILLCIIAAALIFAMGVAYQSYIGTNSDRDKIDSTKVLSSTDNEDSVDIYSPEYQMSLRKMAREETESMEIVYEGNHENDYSKSIIGLWEPYIGSKKSDYRYEFYEDGKFLIHWYSSYEPHEWVVVTKGTYELSGDKFYAKLKPVRGNHRESEWDRTIEYIVNGEMKQTYLEYEKSSKSYKTCEIILKQIR